MRAYERLIVDESSYWGNYTEQALRQGLPAWVDARRATPLQGYAHVFGDPVFEEILRGEFKRRLVSVATSQPGRVLDLGCGAGWLCLELARHGVSVHGIDVSPGQISIAKSYLKSIQEQVSLDIEYEIQDLNLCTLETESYVAAVSWDSLHHIANLDHCLQQVRKALVPGGHLVVFDHVGGAFEWVRNIGRRLFRKPGSPFEDVSAGKQLEVLHRYFGVKTVEFALCMAIFVVQVLHPFCLPTAAKAGLARALRALDQAILKRRFLRGESVFIIAQRD